jgi:NitT/TauT family transport system permease protein
VRQVPPLLVRAGRTMGARGWRLSYRIVLPAALPGYVAGLQQGWAFAWRALMAGELIAGASSSLGLGQKLEFAQNKLDSPQILAVMIVIVLIGMIVDLVIFGMLDRRLRTRRGLLATT